VEVRLLGPVGARVATRPVELGPPQQRCVFAVLAMTPRQTVPVDLMVDRVWGEQVPRNVRTVLYTYVSRLRGLLADGGGRELLRRRDGGYALEIDPDQVDLHRARRLASQGRAAAELAGGDERAAELLAEAAALWAGTPLTGVNGEWAERVRIGLDHERLTLLTERFEAALRVGQAEAVIGPLSQAVAANPLAESLAGLLMLALHRTGRHADALAHYSQLRRRLVDEVGDEPGPALQRLHEQILRRDDSLDLNVIAPRGPSPSPSPSPSRTGVADVRAPATTAQPWVQLCQLPPGTWHFVGREEPAGQLAAQLQPDEPSAVPVALISGPPGVGKTALATAVAQLVRERYPDGQWYVRLGGVAAPRDPAQVAAELLEASGVDGSAIPSGLERRAAALRARLADRRVLLLLDDAADVAQVRPLLPGTPGAAVVVTSRRLLGGLGASSSVRLGPLTDAAAVDLLGRLAGTERIAREPDAAAEVSASCGGLPLALRIAAARLASHPEWTVERFATRLGDRRTLLDELAVDDLAVRPSLELSFHALAPELQRAFRCLGLLGPHDVAPWTVGTLADDDGEKVVEALFSASLLDNVGADATGEPRYRLHELVAAYAAELAEQLPADDRQAPLRRRLAALLQLADAAHHRLHVDITDLPAAPASPPERLSHATVARLTADPTAWLVAERNHLVAALVQACGHGLHQEAALLAERVLPHLINHLGVAATERLYRAVRDAAERASDELVAWRAECHRCTLAILQGPVTQTGVALRRCAEAFERLGAQPELAYSLTIAAACDQQLGDLSSARNLAQRAVEVAEASLSASVAATANARLARVISEQGDYQRSLPLFARAVCLGEEAGRNPVATWALMVSAALEHNDLDLAEEKCRHALSLAEKVHAPRTTGWLLALAADIASARGAAQEAVRLAEEAAGRFVELGDSRGEARANLAAARAYLAAGRANRAVPVLHAAARTYDALGLSTGYKIAQQLLSQATSVPCAPDPSAAAR
jgi:DNA-binding SARP family transcriptional activator/tetratricopeptide (TPR) repeat protein